MDALERFRLEFKGWVLAYNRIKEFEASPDEVLARLEQRIPKATLRQIGVAFINGWLVNEADHNRCYFVKESDRSGPGGGQWTLEPAAGGLINPCWELHVQLADYGRLRTVAERKGLTTRLEDNLMDITVYSGNDLLLYVENKTESASARRLIQKMREYGKIGFELNDPDVGNDELKKSKYLARPGAFPKYFAVSAIDFEQIFLVEYIGLKNRFLLHEKEWALTEPLLNSSPDGTPMPRSVIDPFVLEFERLAKDKIWISHGSGKTSYNFYVPCKRGDAIFLGVYEDGRVWSHITPLGKDTADRLASALSTSDITLDTSKDWHFWRKNGQMVNLYNENPIEIANLVTNALFPEMKHLSNKYDN